METLIGIIAIFLSAFVFGVFLNPFFWQGFRNSKFWDERRHAKKGIDNKNLIDPDNKDF